jgi:hypothetical protein
MNKCGRTTDDGRHSTDDGHSTILKTHPEQAQVSLKNLSEARQKDTKLIRSKKYIYLEEKELINF